MLKLEIYHCSNNCILCFDECKMNCSIMTSMLQSNPIGMYACMYFIGQQLNIMYSCFDRKPSIFLMLCFRQSEHVHSPPVTLIQWLLEGRAVAHSKYSGVSSHSAARLHVDWCDNMISTSILDSPVLFVTSKVRDYRRVCNWSMVRIWTSQKLNSSPKCHTNLLHLCKSFIIWLKFWFSQLKYIKPWK